jgi:hypothetical protein
VLSHLEKLKKISVLLLTSHFPFPSPKKKIMSIVYEFAVKGFSLDGEDEFF